MKLNQALWLLLTPVALGTLAPLAARADGDDSVAGPSLRATATSLSDEPVKVCEGYNAGDLPLVEDCLLALVTIPLDPDRRKASERWAPMRYDAGRCRIQLSLFNDINPRAYKISWLEVAITATQLVTGCTKSLLGRQRTGGQLIRPDFPFYVTVSKLDRTALTAVDNSTLASSLMSAPGGNETLANDVVNGTGGTGSVEDVTTSKF